MRNTIRWIDRNKRVTNGKNASFAKVPDSDSERHSREGRCPTGTGISSHHQGRDHHPGSGSVHFIDARFRSRNSNSRLPREERPILIVLDSSAWLEFFGEGPHAREFTARLKQPSTIVTPTVAMYEVYKWIKRERSEEQAIHAVATMRKTRVIDLSEEIALTAADLSLAHELPMADAFMLATARSHDAELLTTDADFAGIQRVTVYAKKSPA